MRPALATAAVALALALLSFIALVREMKRRETLERRVAAMEESRQGAAPAKSDDSGQALPHESPVPAPDELPVEAQPTPASVADPSVPQLAERVARLEECVRELSGAADGAGAEDFTGLSANQLLSNSKIALSDKLPRRTAALLREFLKRYPADARVPGALLWLAGHERNEGNTKKSVEFYERILKEFPVSKEVAHAEFSLGLLLIGTDLNAGREHFERSIEKADGNANLQANALIRLSDAYTISGQSEIAREYLRRVTTQFAGKKDATDMVKLAEVRLKALEGK